MTLTGRDIAELEKLAADVEKSRPHAARVLRRVLRTFARRGDEQLLTTTAVAEILGVSDQTVRNWADSGWLPSRRLHPLGRRMIPSSAVEGVKAFDAAKLGSELTEEQAVELVRTHRRERSKSHVGPRSR